jgi:hypothetical protein
MPHTYWKPFSYLRWDVATGIWRESGFSWTVPQPIGHDSQWTPYVLHSLDDFSLGLVTLRGPLIHQILLQQIFLWGYLKAQVFTHTLPDINSPKNAIRQEIVNVMQDALRRVLASVPGRWQQCLDCHGGHLQDTDLLNHVQLYLLLCTINVLSYFQNG